MSELSFPVPGELVEAVARRAAEIVLERLRAESAAPPWLTLEQAAERLGCSPDAVRMRAARGRLETRRDGRRVYVSRESVDGLA